jgi:hypothetical protein
VIPSLTVLSFFSITTLRNKLPTQEHLGDTIEAYPKKMDDFTWKSFFSGHSYIDENVICK